MYILDHNGEHWMFKLYSPCKKLVMVTKHSKKLEALQQAQYLRLHLRPDHRDFMRGIQ